MHTPLLDPMILHFPRSLWRHRELLWRLTEREILGRYRGSLLGVGWSFVTPLVMLAIYTFVFSQVFKARWGGGDDASPLAFAVNLFAGLIVFTLFSECLSRAPGLVLANPNYVKKVVFPLEILGCVAVGSAIFHALTSLAILIVFQLVAFKELPLSIIWLPLVWLPLFLSCMACTWLLSALGVFLKDTSQAIGVVLNMLMFLSPVFFPITALPKHWQPLLNINPIAQVIEQTRRVTVQGVGPSPGYLFIGFIIALAICEFSFRIFQRSKRAFADVI